MATLIRIRLPNRSEFKKLVWTKHDHIVILGVNRHIDWNQGFFTHIWGGFLKVVALDYDANGEEPIPFYVSDQEPKTQLRPHHVAEVIRRLIEEIPHFQIIALIMLAVCIGIAGVAAYLAYDAGNKAQAVVPQIRQLLNQTGII